MPDRPTNVAIFGSTGSIGRSTLEVVGRSGRPDRTCGSNQPATAEHNSGDPQPAAGPVGPTGPTLRAAALSAHTSVDLLCEQAREFEPADVIVTDQAAAKQLKAADLPAGTRLHAGPDALAAIATSPDIDCVVAAIVGRAGLESTWAALEAGKRVALANKETLVVAGSLAIQTATKHNATIIPVDSEHSAIFQCLGAGRREDVKRIVLTASGGPFRQHSAAELENVTVEEALAHPTWDMGPKITVDSATMMNKALELIEARWLFGLAAEQIDVVIHPQSVVHSLVEFVDGSVVAQLSPPDMKLPIQYALTWPRRSPCPAPPLDLTQAFSLDFEPPDGERFPAVELGRQVAAAGGTAGAVLNAANEAAVASFLGGGLSFTQIVPACRAVLDAHTFDPTPTLADLTRLDAWARKEIETWK